MITILSHILSSEKPELKTASDALSVVESVGSIQLCVNLSTPSTLYVLASYCIINGSAVMGEGKLAKSMCIERTGHHVKCFCIHKLLIILLH